jgi:hypothetical protein
VGVELGLKLKADVSGQITGIRFYKDATNTGIHIGSLWDSNGKLLAQATFANETTSGWQRVNFVTPVAIAANTVYVASYHTYVGHYAVDINYFSTTGVDNPPLHALGGGVSGGNGVYVYGTNSAFPSLTYQSSNYWVDVVFSASTSLDKTSPTVTMIAPENGATVTGASVAVSANARDNVSVTKVEFYMGNTLLSTDTASPYSFNWNTTTVANGNYTLTAKAYDNAGNIGTSNAILVAVANSAIPPGTTASIWPSTTVPAVTAYADNGAVELGVKFKVDLKGQISGIRFYKGVTNTGIHVGSLWNSNGSLLARSTFTNETASGWQQVNFTSPVAIVPNIVYVASYHTVVGHYAVNTNYFTTLGVDNPPLHALLNGMVGGNGVYIYGINPAFPSSTYRGNNYWVDVLFATNTSSTVTMISP